MHEPFAISRGIQREQSAIIVTVRDAAGFEGRGEACGIPYQGDTPRSMIAVIESAREDLVRIEDRYALAKRLPAGGARCALDAALWDLEAKRTGVPAWRRAGLKRFAALETCYTIGIRSLDGYEAKAAELSRHSLLKIKVNDSDPLEAVRAVRRGSPNARLVVDPNQSWTVDRLKALAPPLAALGVVLLEQPIAVGTEAGLDGYRCPIGLAADELIGDRGDLSRAIGRFNVINIKLDKTGGLTEALALADAAEAAGLRLMVGCMAGSSLSMAPAMILAQRCDFVDLDGPMLQSEDWPNGMVYRDGVVAPPTSDFWG